MFSTKSSIISLLRGNVSKTPGVSWNVTRGQIIVVTKATCNSSFMGKIKPNVNSSGSGVTNFGSVTRSIDTPPKSSCVTNFGSVTRSICTPPKSSFGSVTSSGSVTRSIYTPPKSNERVTFGLGQNNASGVPRAKSKVVDLVTRLVVYSFVFGGGYLAFKTYQRKQRLKDSVDEFLPPLKYVKAKLPLVKFKGCVLSEETVMTGLMERIKNMETRPDDIFVASFPKSGKVSI